jgi:MFS family permease
MQNQKGSLQAALTPSLRLFLGGYFFVELSTMYTLFMPLLMSELGASVVDIGLVYTLAEVVPLGFSIFGGYLSDRFGRLRAITWGNLVTIFSFAVLIFASRWEWMILVYSLQGISWALGGPSYSAYIADSTAEEHRAKVYAIQQNVRNAVHLIRFPLAGWITAQFGFKGMLLTAALVYLIGTIVFAALNRKENLHPEEIESKPTIKTFRKSFSLIISAVLAGGLFTWIFIIDHANDIFLALSNQMQVLYFEQVIGVGVEKIGYLPTIGAVIALMVTVPIGYWVDRRGENIGLGLAYFLLAVQNGIIILAGSFLELVPTAIIYPFMIGLAAPAYKSLISKAVPEGQLGLAFGLTWTSRGLVSLPSPYLGGVLWDRFGPRTPFVVTIIGCLVLSGLAFFKLKTPNDKVIEAV